MDTSRQVATVIADKSESLGAAARQRRSIAEKRRIVEETLVEGRPVMTVWTGRWQEVILPKWTLGIGVRLERRWTLPGKVQLS